MLEELTRRVRDSQGVQRKRQISSVISRLNPAANFADVVLGPGDDAGAIKFQDSFLLLATDSIIPELISSLPYQAGRAAILVNAADIYAMGGRPSAAVNHLSLTADLGLEEVLDGMQEECLRLGIPLIGGHLHPNAREPQLTVAVMGLASRLLRADKALPGHDIFAAIDLRGEAWSTRSKNWDSHAAKSAEVIRADMEILPQLAEADLAEASRDISNAGILGTLGFFLAASGNGGIINVEYIPKPEEMNILDWVEYFPSYGFLLAAPSKNRDKILDRFSHRGIAAARIGKVTSEPQIVLRYSNSEAVLWDLSRESL